MYLLALLLFQVPAECKGEQKLADTYKVPYQLTLTKHVLVRAKINGKGPFNFILDTGAPAVFLSEAAAQAAGVEKKKAGDATIDMLELEGGLPMEKVTCRVEDPFQMTGMNKMNLSGVRLDGFMGYSVLARYRITYDFTSPHLVWTKLDWNPPEVFGLRMSGGKMPAEMAAMTGISSFAANLIGKRPSPTLEYRGLIGVELARQGNQIVVRDVLKNSPADTAGLMIGDEILEFAGTQPDSLKELLDLAAKQKVGSKVQLKFKRGNAEKAIELTTVEGL